MTTPIAAAPPQFRGPDDGFAALFAMIVIAAIALAGLVLDLCR